MKKIIYTFLFLLSYNSVAWSFELPADWIQADLPAPTLFSANQYKEKVIINNINIFSLESKLPAITLLKAKLLKGELKNMGDGVIVTFYSPLSELKNTYQIEVKDLRKNISFTQIWKFNEPNVRVAQISDLKKLAPDIKDNILKMLSQI